MGHHDCVPKAIERAGATRVFHRLPQRPGKPLLGAVGPSGQGVLGLPGNPVSVMVAARRFGAAVLRRLAGFSEPQPAVPMVRLREPDGERLALWWHRLVRLVGDGEAELVTSKGSGDLVSAARSDGFVVMPPDGVGEGPWPYYDWAVPG